MREDYDEDFWDRHSIRRPRNLTGLVNSFEKLVDSCPHEREIQKFIEETPWLLSEQFPHCHAILPQFSLSGQFVADFIAPERSSGGTFWYLIEIERPDHRLLTKDGEFTAPVRKAVAQVRDWMMWLRANQEVAKKSRLQGGLGLYDMSDLIIGRVIIGRRSAINERFNQLRNNLLSSEGIQISTYDSMMEWCRKRAEFWDGYDASWDAGIVPFPSGPEQ